MDSKLASRRAPLPSSLPLPPTLRSHRDCDILIVGAGAAGLLAALAARGVLDADGRRRPLRPEAPDVVLVNNETRLGLKILVSGGSRCNLTNARVDEKDYDTSAPHLVRRILRGFPPNSIQTFFESRGCPLYEEPLGKVFPCSDDAHDILRILLEEIEFARIPIIAPLEVVAIEHADDGLRVKLAKGEAWTARKVILATGGRSLPKTGSRGLGLELLQEQGHTLAAALPGLTPLLLKPTSPVNGLSGLTVPAILSLVPASAHSSQLAGKNFKPLARSGGSLLVTHKGATGPAPFDISAACGQATTQSIALRADFWSLTLPDGPWAAYLDRPKPPGASLPPADVPRPPSLDDFELQADPLLGSRERSIAHAFAERIPRTLLQALLRAAALDPSQPIKQLNTKTRKRLWQALTQTDLQLAGCEGYAKAEVTSGGVILQELKPATLESRLCDHLFCCGELIDATGRLGGFNFQWAWSSGFTAGLGAARGLSNHAP